MFNIIVADNPWSFKDKIKNKKNIKRGAEANYNTISLDELCKLNIKSLASKDWCVLLLWVPSSLLDNGLEVMKAWGFTLKQTYVWIKTAKKDKNKLAFGMGRLFRQSHELCLIGISGKNVYKNLKNRSQRSVCLEPNLKHSAKPENPQDSMDLMFPEAKKLELFARRQKNGWICVGNEAPASLNEDIKDTIENLKKGKKYE
jgi:N6-adenosine-specific RNA methylase IME4